MLANLKRLGGFILDLVFPISCLVCGKEDVYICKNCFGQLPRLEKQLCIVCTKPSPFGKTHPDCVSRNTVDGMICGTSYKDRRINKIIETYKYNFVSDLSESLAKLIVEAIGTQNLDNYFLDFTIVPVPLHKRRYNWRGFNQALLLANALAEKLNVRVDSNLIHRQKFTQPQTTLNAEQRKKNIENAFALNADVTSKKILLIDDVVTSGSTANEIAKLLKKHNASEVWITSVAHG